MTKILFTHADAIFSADKKYRYQLHRIWDKSKPLVAFVGLNPSDAAENKNDPTIWKLSRLAASWNCGGFIIVNLFAIITPQPEEMKKAFDPVGDENDKYLQILSQRKDLDKVIAVWGDDGAFLDRGVAVKNMFKQLWALRISAAGQPRHPRFLKEDVKPIRWD